MPNVIKYTTGSTPSGSLRKGNMLIGNGTADYGLTYYSGITPPAGGYTVYLNKASGGPSIYCPANDSQLISLTNGLAGANYTTAADSLNWFSGQSDKICVNRDLEGVVTNGLVFYLDAGFTPSYPTTGTTLYDLSGGGNDGSLVNGPTFSSSGGGSIVLDAVDDNVSILNTSNGYLQAFSIQAWIAYDSGSSGYHHILTTENYFGSAGWYYGVHELNSNWIGYRVWKTNGSYYNWNGTLHSLNGTWALYTLTVDYQGGINAYVNTTNVRSESTDGTSIKYSGATPWNAFGGNKGKASILRFYNRALTSSEVSQNYNAQKSRFGL